jgi:hypothetical protein
VENEELRAQFAYSSGLCAGFVIAIATTDRGSCLPPEVGPVDLLRVVIRYIDERPHRGHEHFAILILEALAHAWPCKR